MVKRDDTIGKKPGKILRPGVMQKFIAVSLLVNIAVLLPVCAGLVTNAEWTQAVFGGVTPARGILLAVYLSILMGSVLLIVFRGPRAVAALLLVQVIYKLTTPFTVGTWQNPVVISNLGIAAFHIVTLFLIWRVLGNPLVDLEQGRDSGKNAQ